MLPPLSLSNSSVPTSDIKLIITLCPVLAILITFIRVVIRIQHSGLWWDDGLALLSAVHVVLASVGAWIQFMDPSTLAKTTRIAAYYLLSEAFYGAVWSARLSILFSIVRISPETSKRTLLYRVAIVFTVIWAFLFVQLFWVCVPERSWTERPGPLCCILTLQVPVCQLITDVFSDCLLIAFPLRLFIGSTLERGLKIRLVAIFSASILTTVVSLVHAVYTILNVGGVDEFIATVLELSVSLVVCNLSVVVTALYRACGLGEQVHLARVEPSKGSSLMFATARSQVTPAITLEWGSTGSSHDAASTRGTESTDKEDGGAKEVGKAIVL